MVRRTSALCRLICLCSLVLPSPLGAWAQSLTILTEINPPLQIKLANGEPGGPTVAVVREIQRRVNNTDPIELVPWARGYRAVETQANTALFVMARTASRDPQFQWVGPFTEAVYALYVKADSKIVLKDLDDAKQLKSIGVYRDDARDQLLTQAGFTNLDRTVDNSANVKKLMLGRIEAFASSNTAIEVLMASLGYPGDSVRAALPLTKIQTWMAFSKQTPESTVRAWADALEAMKKDKTFETIMVSGIPGWTPAGKAVTQFPER